MHIKNLSKLHWLVITKAGEVLVEVQERGDSTAYHRASDKQVHKAVESGARHLTNYGLGIAANLQDDTQNGYLTSDYNRCALQAYLAFSYGDALPYKDAYAIIKPPEDYKPGSFTLAAPGAQPDAPVICPEDGNLLAEDGVCGFCGNAPEE